MKRPNEASMKIHKLSDLFLHTLQDIYYAENHIVKALPKMIKTSDSSELSKAFADHLEQTKEHVTRLCKSSR
jgi:ferritin-like metal-binding protein YciE